MFSYGLLHMDTPKLADQQKITFISCIDNEWHLEDLLSGMAERNDWWENKKNLCSHHDMMIANIRIAHKIIFTKYLNGLPSIGIILVIITIPQAE